MALNGKKLVSALKIEALRLTTRRDPSASFSNLRAGDIARDSKNWSDAIKHYRDHIGQNPRDAGIMVQLGHVYKESGQFREAKTAYRGAAAQMPNDADLSLQLGHLAKVMGDRRAMLIHYARAFELDPSMQDPYQELLEHAPKTARGWSEALATKPLTSHHNFPGLVEPALRSPSPADAAIDDPTRTALQTIRIARSIRSSPPQDKLSQLDQDYAVSKLAIFNSSYIGAMGVYGAIAALGGTKLDQGASSANAFAFGTVPSRHLSHEPFTSGNVIMDNYRSRQIAASERFVLQPALRGSIKKGPLICILLPVYRGPAIYVERAILSALLQTYANIQLCIVDDCSDRPDLTALLAYYAFHDARISLVVHKTNQGISAASNSALRVAKGSYIALLDHDDMLAHDAIEKVAKCLQDDPKIDLVYTDECKIDADDIADEVFTKPDWSPCLLTSVMYTGHLSVYRKSLVEEVGAFRTPFDFSQDYDLALRVAEQSPKVHHLAECLYAWRMISGSAAQGDKPLARLSNISALQSAAERRSIPGRVLGLEYSNRIKRARAVRPDLVSIIIPSDNTHNIVTTLASILIRTAYPNFEIIVVANSDCIGECEMSYVGDQVKYIPYDLPYNFSGKCNAGAIHATGEHLIFFNDDVRVTDLDWLDVVLEALLLPGVGIVGPKLLYENGAIQHGGMVTGVRNFIGTAFHTFPDKTPAHFGFAQTVREVSLICGACLAIKRSTFKKIGGFDAINTPIAHSDVDLCFRVREIGLTCVYTPHTELTHIGHLSIGAVTKVKKVQERDKADIFLLTRWGHYCSYDPYFPPGMRDLLYIDSQQPFSLYTGKRKAFQTRANNTLIVSHDLSGSGAPKVVYDMVEVLLAKDHYVLVVSPEDGPFRQHLLAIGADVIVDPLCITGTNVDFLALARRFETVILNTVVTWRILNQVADASNVYWYVHETELVGHLARLHPEIGQKAAAVGVWAGSAKAATALSAIGVKSTIIEYGVAPSKIVTASRQKNAKTVIAVLATYEPRKGQDLAILAIHAMPREVRDLCEFRFAGRINDQPFFDALLAIDEDLSMVSHKGALTLEEYQRNLLDADIILCPSRDDTLPLVSLDALANGKILVCTPMVGTSAYLQTGVSGFVARSGTPTHIADALMRAVAAQPTWPQISRAAVELFKTSFSKERFAEQIGKLLDPASKPVLHPEQTVVRGQPQLSAP